MGAVEVHDRRPGTEHAPVDEYGYGPELAHSRRRRPLHIGELVRLPDGSRWPVVDSRLWVTGHSWRQAVSVGRGVVPVERPAAADWAALAQLVG